MHELSISFGYRGAVHALVWVLNKRMPQNRRSHSKTSVVLCCTVIQLQLQTPLAAGCSLTQEYRNFELDQRSLLLSSAGCADCKWQSNSFGHLDLMTAGAGVLNTAELS